MPTDREILTSAGAGRVGSSGMAADANTAVSKKQTRYYQFLVSDVGTADRAVTTTAIHMPVRGKVVSVSMTAPKAVTADDTSYATLTVAKQTGTSATTIASKTTKITGGSGDLAAAVPYKFPAAAFTASAQQMAADDVLTIAIAKASSGVALTTAITVAEGTSGTGDDAFSTDYFNVCVGVEEN